MFGFYFMCIARVFSELLDLTRAVSIDVCRSQTMFAQFECASPSEDVVRCIIVPVHRNWK